MLLLLAIAFTGFFAASLGTMVGLGGGVFIVPILAIFLGVDLKVAIATGAICVVLNSLRSSSFYLKARLVNLRLALLLLISTALAASLGGLFVVFAPISLLKLLFAILLGAVVIIMIFRPTPSQRPALGPDPLKLRGSFLPPSSPNEPSPYVPQHLRYGVGLSAIAGLTSGLLGIGGGAIQVPIMNTLMGVPLRVAIATSTFMVGITAVVSAIIYTGAGLVDPSVTIPALAGILLGSHLGSYAGARFPLSTLRRLLITILTALTLIMAIDALRSLL